MEKLSAYPTFWDFMLADKLMNILAMQDTASLMMKQDLSALAPFAQEGCWWTRGRIAKESLRLQLGHPKLLILSNKSRLAKLMMIQAHREDHRYSPGDALFRTRTFGVYIYRGRSLAEEVVKECQHCKLQRATETQQQVIGDLPKERFAIPTRPFSMIAVDFLGPMMVKEHIRSKNTYKIYPCVFTCFHVGALHVEVCKGYSTEQFLAQLDHFCSLRGTPKKIFTDLGSQLSKAGKLTSSYATDNGDQDLHWDQVQAKTASRGIEWYQAPAATPWRNGRAEAMVKMLKRSMKAFTDQGPMTCKELTNMLDKCAAAINNRPLGVRHFGGAEPDVEVITPNLMLMGSRSGEATSINLEKYAEDNSIYTRRLVYLEKLYLDWWAWYPAVFDSLVPLKRWTKAQRNVRVGDIVLIKYQKKLTPARYKMARVIEAEADPKGNVRTVTVVTRPTDVREKALPYRVKELTKMRLPVQRLVVLHAAEELHNVESPNLLEGLTPKSENIATKVIKASAQDI